MCTMLTDRKGDGWVKCCVIGHFCSPPLLNMATEPAFFISHKDPTLDRKLRGKEFSLDTGYLIFVRRANTVS